MKTFITTLILTGLVFGANAQIALIPGGMPQDVLFRNYDNVLFVEDTEGLNRIFKVELTGGELVVLEPNDGNTSTGRYVVSSFDEYREAVLTIRDNEGNTMNSFTYKISRMPDPEIRFNTADGNFSSTSNTLIAHCEAFSFVQNMYEVGTWEIQVNGATINSGKGKTLDELAMTNLKNLPKGTAFTVEVYLEDFNGIGRKKSANFIKN